MVSVELVNGCVPTDLYNMNTGWNIFSFTEDTRQYSVTLTPGQYTVTELCTELQRALNALPGVINSYSIIYSSITKKINIVALNNARIFSLNFLDPPYTDTIDSTSAAIQSIGCPARIFGFENWIYNSAAGAIAAPNRMDPSLFLQRLYLHLNADNSIEFNRVEMGAGRHDCFHIIYLDHNAGGYYTLNRDTYTPIFYSSPTPISRIATLNISLRDEFYRVVDLGGHDFTLVFEITYLE